MIELILLFPLIASIILFLFKSVKLNKLTILIYAVLHFLITLTLYFKGIDCSVPKNIFDLFIKTDNLNILFLLVLSTVFLGVAVYNNNFMKTMESTKRDLTFYSIAILLFIFSVTGTVLSANLGLSWVFIEATTLASAYLIYFNKTKYSIEAAWKYVFICSIGIALAFVGIIILSIATGKMNSLFFNDLYLNAQKINPFWLKLAFVFILTGFGTKMGLAPVHACHPDADSEAPSPIAALLSTVLLNSAFLIILRVFKLMVLTHTDHYARILLVCMGLLSLFITAVFISNINNYKRMLAFSSIENMGIIAIGTAVGGIGLFAALLHMVGHSLIKSSFFLTAGNILKIFKTKRIDEVCGLITVNKITGWLWVICFVGLVGLPPSPLFISEFLLLKTLILKNQFAITGIFLILLTIILYGMGKSIMNMSFGNVKTGKTFCHEPILDKYIALNKLSFALYFPQIVFISISIVIGVYLPPFLTALIKNAMSVM